MICYLDTSALVKLYVEEEGSGDVRKLIDTSLLVATCQVAYAEVRAALARGYREGLLNQKEYHQTVTAFQLDWGNYLSIAVSDTLIAMAGNLAEKQTLRGFDAIHLAAALILDQQFKEQIIVGCWDARLWDALGQYNLSVVPPARPGSR